MIVIGKARQLIEDEDPKRLLKAQTARHITPTKFTWNEIERIQTVLGMGPVRRRPGDERMLKAGLFAYYEDSFDYVDGNRGACEALYDRSGSIRREWLAEPSRWRGRVRTYYWPRQESENPKRLLKQKAPRWKDSDRYHVHSSGGEFLVWPNGTVAEWKPDQGIAADDEDFAHYRDIVKFDLEEWRRFWGAREDISRVTKYDILDLGLWLQDGSYTPPDSDYREMALGN